MARKIYARENRRQKPNYKLLKGILPEEQIKSFLRKIPLGFSLRLRNFRQKYPIASGSSPAENKQNAQELAWQIKENNPDLLQNIGKFLYDNGILLFCILQETLRGTGTNDGYLIFDSFERGLVPSIVIAKDIPTPRRRFFTIAHELYHILVGSDEDMREAEAEDPANQFAGALLLSKAEVLARLKLEQGQCIPSEKIEESLKVLYQSFPISLECMINTLADYDFITKEQRKEYAGKSQRQRRETLIETWKLPADLAEILDIHELLQGFERKKQNSVKLLVVKDVISSDLCISVDDGEKLFYELKSALQQSTRVSLSFLGCNMIVPLFLNVAIAQLYETFSEEEIQNNLLIEDLNPEDMELLKIVLENAKKYYKNSQEYDFAQLAEGA